VHDIHHGAGAAILPIELSVERAGNLIDPIQVPEQVFRIFFTAAGKERDRVFGVERNFDFAAMRRDETSVITAKGKRDQSDE
ncbi:MAG: hypothetical protein ACXW2X_07545, partial [Thermoanaerobaculia bacterium]